MSELNKLIMKTPTLEGVDMSVNNLEMFTSVRIRWTKVSHAMTKRNGITFLGTKEQLLPGDVIQVGNLGLKYKVISLKKLEDKPQGYIYRVKRVDGAHTTSTDISNILVGQKVQIVSNKTFQQIFEQHPDVPHIEICPVEIPDTEFCCPYKVVTAPPLEYTYFQYTLNRPINSLGFTLSYIYNGIEESHIIPTCDQRLGCTLVFCAAQYTIKKDGNDVIAINEVCKVNPCVAEATLTNTGVCP